MKRLLQSTAVLLFVVLLTSCTLSPAAAIRREPLLPASDGEPINLQIRQSVHWRNGAFVYYTFDSDQLDPPGITYECGYFAYVQRGLLDWHTTSGGGICRASSEVADPFQRTGSYGDDETGTYGLVTDPAAVEVRVTWSDGLTDTVALVNESYLVMHAAQASVERVEALDAAGTVVAAYSPSATDRETTAPLPTPATVNEAVLVNLRPLTTSGLAEDATWAPDGQAVAYTVFSAPPVPYREPPEMQVWLSDTGGSGAHMLAEGHSPLFSTDGRTIYFLRDVPDSGLRGLWAVDTDGSQLRELIPPTSGIHVYQLTDGGWLVLNEWGAYAPLRLFDPSSGESVNLMADHYCNHPQDACLSPDGTLLAYPQKQSVYLAQADGSSPRLLSEDGGFSARVWWSPDSRYLAYTTGAAPTDSLLLANRDGKVQATLLSQEESGYVSTLVCSPDSRWLLVATDAYFNDPPPPTRLTLFDTEGNRQLLLEAYLHDVAWSPDGRTLALSLWDGPQGELATDNIWLADLTDRATAAQFPQPTATPSPSPAPPLPLPDADLSPEDVIRRFWQAINVQDYRTAWAALTADTRAHFGRPRFEDYYRCVRAAEVIDIQPFDRAPETMFEVNVKVDIDPACDTWMSTPGAFVIMVRETPAGPWLIESFNTGP